jgi:hypothetical protein
MKYEHHAFRKPHTCKQQSQTFLALAYYASKTSSKQPAFPEAA